MRIAIVGTGLMGSWIGQGLRRAGCRVVGYDRNALASRRALSLGSIDVVARAMEDIGPVEIAVIALPPMAVAAIARDLLDAGVPVVTDIAGSHKAAIVASVGRSNFVGGHPMVGSERSGPEAAVVDIFARVRWILTPGDRTDSAAVELVGRMAESLGACPVIVSPSRHDELVATISHLPHVAAAAVALLAGDQAHRAALAIAGKGFGSVTRTAKGDPELWTGILAGSPALPQQLEELANIVLGFAAALRAGDLDGLHRLLELGQRAVTHVTAGELLTARQAEAPA